MLIIIDGYNLLKYKFWSEFIKKEQIENFIKELSPYAKEKQHEIIVVFDAGPTFWPSLEKKLGIEIVYSGLKLTADDYIKSFIENNQDKKIILVSSDRILVDLAIQRGAYSIDSKAFCMLIKERGSRPFHFVKIEGGVHKITSSNDEYLDNLMKEGSKILMLKDEKIEKDNKQDKVKQKKSKRDRNIIELLKKL